MHKNEGEIVPKCLSNMIITQLYKYFRINNSVMQLFCVTLRPYIAKKKFLFLIFFLKQLNKQINILNET